MKRTPIAVTLITGFVLAGALIAEDKLPEVSHDGLHLVPGSEVAAAWVKPEADFSGYDKIMILEAHVAFRKNWAQDHNRTSINKVYNRDVERIKKTVAELFRETFTEVLGEGGGYPVVDAADTDVLLLRPAILDLDVTAPDLDKPGRTYSASASAGAMTLFLELYDSVSGEILARVIDRQIASDHGGQMRWTNRVANRQAAIEILSKWAKALRDRLDEVHGR